MKLPSMDRVRVPRAALFAFFGAGCVSAAKLRRGGSAASVEPADVEANLAPMLLDFTQELKTGVSSGTENAAHVVGWCKVARGTKAGMASVLLRQLDETGMALKQVALEEDRLGSEAKLADAALTEQRQRLAAAAATGEAANATFETEAEHMDKALKAAFRAQEMLSMKQLQQAQDGSDDVPSEDVPMTDDVSSGLELSQSQQMLQKLRVMYTKLNQEKSVAVSQHSTGLQKMAAFQDHLNSSLMDSVSQVASISVETSRRKRERSRLQARRAGIEALLGAVRVSVKATDEACSEEELHQGELGELITAEKKAVAALLRSLRAGEVTGDAAAESAGDAAPAFVQLFSESAASEGANVLRSTAAQLRGLAQRFPTSAALLEDSAKLRGVLMNKTAVDADPLAKIQAFVSSEHQHYGTSAHDAARHYARDLYTNLVGDVRKKAMELVEQRSQCSALTRDAAVDEAALTRSLKTVEAKLHMTKAAIAEYQRSSEYYKAQSSLLDSQLNELRGLAAVAKEQLADGQGARLQGFAQKLLNLASEGASEDEGKTAQVLAQRIEEHRNQLQQRADRLAKQVAAVAQADGPLLSFLQEEAQQSQRLLRRVAAEAELLESRAAAKADDEKLGQHFRSLVENVCTPQKLQQLNENSEELQRLGGELRKLASGDRQLAMTAGDELGEAELANLLK